MEFSGYAPPLARFPDNREFKPGRKVGVIVTMGSEKRQNVSPWNPGVVARTSATLRGLVGRLIIRACRGRGPHPARWWRTGKAWAGSPGVGGGTVVKHPVRSLAVLAVAVVTASCNSGDSPKAVPGSSAPVPAPASVAKPPESAAPVRDMRPADPRPEEPKPVKTGESKSADEPPPLVPPAGSKDERTDAAGPK